MATQKRILDIIFSIITLILLSPILVLISILIFLSDGSPIIYYSQRVGYAGKIFTFYKFRTLRKNSWDKNKAFIQKKNDSRIFPFGRLLRSTHMDELPQFLNVLKGDMSIIGPRPLLPGMRKGTLCILPGITGLAQVKYMVKEKSNCLSVHEIRYDEFYIKKQSFMLDVWIAFKTIGEILHARGI